MNSGYLKIGCWLILFFICFGESLRETASSSPQSEEGASSTGTSLSGQETPSTDGTAVVVVVVGAAKRELDDEGETEEDEDHHLHHRLHHHEDDVGDEEEDDEVAAAVKTPERSASTPTASTGSVDAGFISSSPGLSGER
jgi:hypothetical protein